MGQQGLRGLQTRRSGQEVGGGGAGLRLVLAPWRLVSAGQDDGAVRGDCDRVLGVSGPAAVSAAEGPAVGVDAIAVLAAGQEPRLDRYDQPRAEPEAAPGAALVGYRWSLVHEAADAVSPEIGADPVADCAPHGSDRCRYVPDPRSGHG